MSVKARQVLQHLNHNRVAVRCTHAYRSKQYVLLPGREDSVVIIKAGCPIMELCDGETVVTVDGEKVQPTGRFFITAETIDPYHYLFDIF